MSQKKTKKPQLVKKPIYRGKVIEKAAAKRGAKVLGSMVLVMVLYLIFGPMLMVENTFLRVVFNIALMLVAVGIMSMMGTGDGESDAALGEIVYQRKQDGKEVSKTEEDRCFNPLKGFFTAYLGAALFFVLAVVLAIFTKEESYVLGVLPTWAQNYYGDTSVGQGLDYYQISRSIGWLDIVRLAVRANVLPIFSMFEASTGASILLERLTPLFVLIAPTGYALGYLRGKKVREMIHSSIALSKKKKNKKDKKEKKERQNRNRQPEQLV